MVAYFILLIKGKCLLKVIEETPSELGVLWVYLGLQEPLE